MVRYKENDILSYADNPLGLLPSRFIVNSKSNWNITGIFVCIFRLYAYYPVWLLLSNTTNDWYLKNAPFFIVYSLIFGLLNYTLYILISFGDPGFLKSCPSTKLKPVDKIRDPLKLKFNLELRNLNKVKNKSSKNDADVFGSSDDEEMDEIDLEAGPINNLQVNNESIDDSSFEVLDDKSFVDSSCNSYSNDLNFSNSISRLGNGTTTFPLLNTSNLIKSPIRIDKSTANLSLVMEGAPGQILHSIGVSQFSLNNNKILENLLNNNESECFKLSSDLLKYDGCPENRFINGGDSNREGSIFRLNLNEIDQKTPKSDKLTHPISNLNSNSLSFPLSPCSSDGVDLLPRRKMSGTNLKNSCFQSNDGYFVFKEGKMYQNGVRLRFCDYCRMYQPLRTKHCTSCERCIRTHDHHCPWLGVCIGEYNRCKFWWLSLVQFPECIWILYCISICLFKADLNNSRPTIFDISSLIFIAGNALFIAFLSLLLVIYHLFLAYNNLTTWENLAWNKISYLKPFPDTQNSPFSKGHIYNMAIFCIPYYVDDLIIGEEGEIIWERKPPNNI